MAAAAATACWAVLLAGAGADPPTAAASERVTCPPGFELGALTLSEARQLPRFVQAFEDGVFTDEGFQAAFGPGGFFDRNANGILCFKDVIGLHQTSPYTYEIIDDPGGNPG